MISLARTMVEAFHCESLARFGGADGLRDEGLLLSALARAENIQAYEPEADVFHLAEAYCTGVVKNHPFIDVNKRTGVLSAIVFLELNGVVHEFEETAIVTMVYGLAASEVTEENFAVWLRAARV
jgi:death on curing protein